MINKKLSRITCKNLIQFCLNRKYILCIFLAVVSKYSSFSQPIIGTYIGINSSGEIFKLSKNGKKKITQDFSEEKKLELFADSSFILTFRQFNIESSVGNEKRYCTGIWKVNMDTLKLFSTFKMQDFCRVEEKFLPTTENDLVKIAIRNNNDSVTPSTWIYSAQVFINSESYGQCKMNDTLYCKLKHIPKIVLTSSSPRYMRWRYVPALNKSNCFTFYLKTSIQDENICLENSKLLVQGSKLIPLDIFEDLYVDRHNYEIKR
jgi:hypothetical protein